MFTSRRITALAVGALVLPLLSLGAQSSVTVSPFASYVPSAAVNPLAGFALTFGGTTGLALRSGAQLSISNPDSAARAAGGNRPWGADADIMLYLGGLGGGATVFQRALAPYLFSGIGLFGEDSAGKSVTRNGWSYGLGAAIPLGLHADVFGEARWRMPEYVLPTADGAPDSKSEMRFGLSFHVGGAEPRRRPAPRRRYYESYEEDEEPVVVREVVREAPPPAPPPQVIVVQSAPPPPPPPQVVVVQQPAPQPRRRAINVNIPVILTPSRSRRSRSRGNHVTVVQARPRVDTVVVIPKEARRPRRP